MNRRNVLQKILGLSALVATHPLNSLTLFANERHDRALKPLVGNPLRFPPEFSGDTLTLASANATVWPNTTTQVVAINGSYPAPTIRVKRGANFSVKFVNQLSEESTIHWHGLIVPESMDGQPKDAVQPGKSFTYSFPIIQRAGTYFYHPHPHMKTASQVYRGFAGFFIIEDDLDDAFNLPKENFDVPLLIQDRRSSNKPQFTYNPTMMDTMSGYLGDVPLINGTPDAYLEVSKTLYRFRLLNGSNARIYNIAFSDNRSFHIIATDGGLKDAPASAKSFLLSPGERVEILVDFYSDTIGQSVTLKSLAFPRSGMGNFQQGMEMDLLRFDVTGSAQSGAVVPQSFNPIQYYNSSDAVRTRPFLLTSAVMGRHNINGNTYQLNRIDQEVPMSDLEEWSIASFSDEYHPMHLHGVLFQLLERDGNTDLAPHEKGWKDTVLIHPNESVRVLIKFSDYAGIYLFHCHNLEHEDEGMMLNFRVAKTTSVREEGSASPDEFTLHQNYPNPFSLSGATTIEFELKNPSRVHLAIFNEEGRMIDTLVSEFKHAGKHSVAFNSMDLHGRSFPAGVYFARMRVGGLEKVIKMFMHK